MAIDLHCHFRFRLFSASNYRLQNYYASKQSTRSQRVNTEQLKFVIPLRIESSEQIERLREVASVKSDQSFLYSISISIFFFRIN